jgi:hypothetical protein
MFIDDFPGYAIYGNDEDCVSFEDRLFYDQNSNVETLFGDVTEITTTFCSFALTTPTSPLFPIQNNLQSLLTFNASHRNGRECQKLKRQKEEEERLQQKPHHNQIKKGDCQYARKESWDCYLYEGGY